MNSGEKKLNEKNNIYICDREKAEFTGIFDVLSFTDTNITVSCKYGCISIEGKDLKIENFNSTTGDLSVNGTVDGFFYFGKGDNEKKGKLLRLFR